MIGLKRETEGAKIFQLIEKERKSQREREREIMFSNECCQMLSSEQPWAISFIKLKARERGGRRLLL